MNDFTITIVVIVVSILAVIVSVYLAYINLIKRINNLVDKQNEKMSQHHNNLKIKIKEDVNLLNSNVEKYINEVIEKTNNIESSLANNQKILNNGIDAIKVDIGLYKTEVQRQLNHIRLENIINFHSELAKYKNGVYEDEYFIQEVSECKIFKIVDKKTDETTNIYYDGNIKNCTETFADNRIKNKMYYSKDGSLVKGEDFNQGGSLIFSYTYDEAGEISNKTEYIYNNGNIIDEVKTKY